MAMAEFQHENSPDQTRSAMPSTVSLPDGEQRRTIQMFAYQIYREKGGAAMDNWLEAERRVTRPQP